MASRAFTMLLSGADQGTDPQRLIACVFRFYGLERFLDPTLLHDVEAALQQSLEGLPKHLQTILRDVQVKLGRLYPLWEKDRRAAPADALRHPASGDGDDYDEPYTFRPEIDWEELRAQCIAKLRRLPWVRESAEDLTHDILIALARADQNHHKEHGTQRSQQEIARMAMTAAIHAASKLYRQRRAREDVEKRQSGAIVHCDDSFASQQQQHLFAELATREPRWREVRAAAGNAAQAFGLADEITQRIAVDVCVRLAEQNRSQLSAARDDDGREIWDQIIQKARVSAYQQARIQRRLRISQLPPGTEPAGEFGLYHFMLCLIGGAGFPLREQLVLVADLIESQNDDFLARWLGKSVDNVRAARRCALKRLSSLLEPAKQSEGKLVDAIAAIEPIVQELARLALARWDQGEDPDAQGGAPPRGGGLGTPDPESDAAAGSTEPGTDTSFLCWMAQFVVRSGCKLPAEHQRAQHAGLLTPHPIELVDAQSHGSARELWSGQSSSAMPWTLPLRGFIEVRVADCNAQLRLDPAVSGVRLSARMGASDAAALPGELLRVPLEAPGSSVPPSMDFWLRHSLGERAAIDVCFSQVPPEASTLVLWPLGTPGSRQLRTIDLEEQRRGQITGTLRGIEPGAYFLIVFRAQTPWCAWDLTVSAAPDAAHAPRAPADKADTQSTSPSTLSVILCTPEPTALPDSLVRAAFAGVLPQDAAAQVISAQRGYWLRQTDSRSPLILKYSRFPLQFEVNLPVADCDVPQRLRLCIRRSPSPLDGCELSIVEAPSSLTALVLLMQPDGQGPVRFLRAGTASVALSALPSGTSRLLIFARGDLVLFRDIHLLPDNGSDALWPPQSHEAEAQHDMPSALWRMGGPWRVLDLDEVAALHKRAWAPGLSPSRESLRFMLQADLIFGAVDASRPSGPMVALVHVRRVSAGQPLHAHVIAGGQLRVPSHLISQRGAASDAMVCYAAIADPAQRRRHVAQSLILHVVLPYLEQAPEAKNLAWLTSSPLTCFISVGRLLVLTPMLRELVLQTDRAIARSRPLGCASLRELLHLAGPYFQSHLPSGLGAGMRDAEPEQFFRMLYTQMPTHEELLDAELRSSELHVRLARMLRELQDGTAIDDEQSLLRQRAAFTLMYLAVAITQTGIYDGREGWPVDPFVRFHRSNGARLHDSLGPIPFSRPEDTAAWAFGQCFVYGKNWREERLAYQELIHRHRTDTTGQRRLLVDLDWSGLYMERMGSEVQQLLTA